MPDRTRDNREEDLEQFLDLVRKTGPDSSDLLQLLPSPGEVSKASLERTVDIARLARSLSKNELTLGKYLSSLRTKRRLSRTDVAKEAHLSPDAIGELESDTVAVQSIPAARMAVLAAYLDAFKLATLELLQKRLDAEPAGGLPRLTRMDSEATQLEAERARRHTQAAHPRLPADHYLSDFASAFDEERVRRHQP